MLRLTAVTRAARCSYGWRSDRWNTAIISPSGGSIGLGFSMASNTVDPVVKQLKEYGEVRRGWLGVNIGSVNDEMAEALGLDEPTGAIIRDVFDGPAKDAGLKTMDVIVMFDGKEVADSGALVRIVGGTPVGSTVKTIVLRDGKRMSIDVVPVNVLNQMHWPKVTNLRNQSSRVIGYATF